MLGVAVWDYYATPRPAYDPFGPMKEQRFRRESLGGFVPMNLQNSLPAQRKRSVSPEENLRKRSIAASNELLEARIQPFRTL
jgi:hypothetical protein